MFHSPEVRPALAVVRVRVCLEFLIKVLPVTPAPLDSGKVKGCDGFYQASTSQNCQGLLKVYSIISEKKHLGCNPGLKGDCNAFKSGYWYCVADFASMSLTIVLLLYFQPGTISGCQRVYFVKDVDSCWSIANSNGIDLR